MYGAMEILMKVVFGWIKDKARLLYIIRLGDATKAIGKMIRRKEKEFYFKMNEQLKYLIIDSFQIYYLNSFIKYQ